MHLPPPLSSLDVLLGISAILLFALVIVLRGKGLWLATTRGRPSIAINLFGRIMFALGLLFLLATHPASGSSPLRLSIGVSAAAIGILVAITSGRSKRFIEKAERDGASILNLSAARLITGGRPAEARAACMAGLRREPGNEVLRINLATAEALLGHRKEALRIRSQVNPEALTPAQRAVFENQPAMLFESDPRPVRIAILFVLFVALLYAGYTLMRSAGLVAAGYLSSRCVIAGLIICAAMLVLVPVRIALNFRRRRPDSPLVRKVIDDLKSAGFGEVADEILNVRLPR